MSNQMRRESNTNRNFSDEVAYQKGYQTGRDSERLLQEETYAVREENSTASGLMIGLALASIAALAGGSIYFLNARNEPIQQTAPSTQVVPVPVPNNSQPRSSNKETTIIERTIDKTREAVPVPQQPAKDPEAPAPNINIQLPTPQQDRSENQTSPSPVQPQTNQAEPEQQGRENQTSPSPVQLQTNQAEPEQQGRENQTSPSPVQAQTNQAKPETSNSNQ
jgi:hypothetical protein